MKKTLISLAALMVTIPVMAAEPCAYSPLQNLIRTARDAKGISQLIQSGVNFSEKTRCGGSLMQLAVLRGNPQVLGALISQDKSRANEMVDLQAYPISGAPKEIPLILFAAYYAPNAEIIQVLLENGADGSKTDSQGRNLLWYMDQNAVLRSTALTEQLNQYLLNSLVPTQRNQQNIKFNQQTSKADNLKLATVQDNQSTEENKKETQPSVVEATLN